jgi:hypothetical protein
MALLRRLGFACGGGGSQNVLPEREATEIKMATACYETRSLFLPCSSRLPASPIPELFFSFLSQEPASLWRSAGWSRERIMC